MEVFSIATQNPTAKQVNDTLIDAIILMAEKNFRRVPIVDIDFNMESRQLIGIITANDVLQLLLGSGIKVLKAPLGEIMREDPIAAHKNDSLGQATAIMAKYGFGGLPIVENDNFALIGIVTERDIVRVFVESIADADLSTFLAEPVKCSWEKGTIIDSIEEMVKYKSSRVILTNRKKKIKGIVSSSDIMGFIAKEYIHNPEIDDELFSTLLKNIATTDVETVNAHTSVAEVAKDLLERKVGGVPIINDDGLLIGTFSERELLKMIGLFGLFADE